MTEAMTADRPSDSRSPQGLANARILLVDDDATFLRALAEVLTRRLDGASVETCRSPMDALGRIEARDYDVVVTDLLMGGLHGFELLDRIRSMRPTVLVVLMTGADDRDSSVRALRGGAYDFIHKPVDPDYLAACVHRAVETRRLRAEVERQQAALRRHAEELEVIVAQRTEELRRASRTKDEFLATISHELRTPLTAILGWARLLNGGKLDASEKAQAIESIARNATSQAQLIDDLLDVSRIITGKLRLDIRQVNLVRVIDGALGVVLPAAQAKGVEVERRLDETVEPISGDPNRLQQVLWNLLSNAVKFTPAGGRVAVRLARRETGHVSTRPPDPQTPGRAQSNPPDSRPPDVEIVVEDNGAGIAPDFLPFVFDRFRQGDSHLSSRRGLGLGLAIAQHLVELHGGTITAESAGPGAGATFTVVLPRPARVPSEPRSKRREQVSSSRIDGATAGFRLRGVRVLVVDDEEDTRQVVRLLLVQAGATVELASSVVEAHEVFLRTRPDVLLCDIGLGADDGYALLRALRTLPRELGGGVPAVALTGYAKPEDRARALEAGFDLHLAKPGPADLPQILADLLEWGELE